MKILFVIWLTILAQISLGQNPDSLYRIQIDKEYYKQIEDGKKYFATGQFFDAKKSFQQACSIKPNEVFPKDMILKTDQEIARQQNLYHQVKLMEDNQVKGKFAEAYILADEVLILDPSNQKALEIKIELEPKVELLEKDPILNHRFDSLLHKGDICFLNKGYTEAINNYELARKIFPHKTYPKNQLTKIKAIQTEMNYYRLIDIGDSLTIAGYYSEALDNYGNARKIHMEDSLLLGKIENCRQKWYSLTEIPFAETYDAFFNHQITGDSLMSVISKGLKITPENQSLQEARTYFEIYFALGMDHCSCEDLKEIEPDINSYFSSPKEYTFEKRDDEYGPRCGYFIGNDLFIGYMCIVSDIAPDVKLKPIRTVYQFGLVSYCY